ncbi:Pseudouridine-metabolizing bifunctional protein -like protein [Emericellopsis cladophorae]|uniref:Pseudouridine-metabolizing bifunctional protein -like protein n=1 Tax=Emericellopsis cladophorae TaxID=2686198 RepID=A0A9P9Y2C4_9HYPO|nr:Pseudouridine-metabolizing bifunctional protein -like protein [Emericellopsis cladophorae]KAI6782217.1 Pseudouridine-metabolizing bifunctional protein -like protein [Emericellopsis cladophorae]
MSCQRVLTPLRRQVPRSLRSACKLSRCFSLSGQSQSQGFADGLHVSKEIRQAIADRQPVVALESTIYTHGAMGKDLAHEHEELIRSYGGIPAIIAIVDGVPTVGVSPSEIVQMIEAGNAVKVSRRDVSYLVGMGLAGRKIHGGTTISGTMLLARLAGIRVFGTGGLGGVHRGGENTMDVSADLTELGRTRVAVVASGCKGFLDIPRTLEFLETQGCLVSTFADGRSKNIDFPGFWARNSGTPTPSVVNTEREAAAMILSQERLNIESGLLFANPVPEEYGIPLPEIRAAIEQAVTEADEKGFTGSKNTPYVLGRLKELTGNKAVVANIALVKSNLIRAANVAVELARLEDPSFQPTASQQSAPSAPVPAHAPISSDPSSDILVAGSVAVDLSCNYTPSSKGETAPQLHTSNPAAIRHSVGGVGHNVAVAAHRASGDKSRVKLASLIANDTWGSTILSSLESEGLDPVLVSKLLDTQTYRTAQYVAINDGKRDLVMAMADMDIFNYDADPDLLQRVLEQSRPKWLVVDGNWSETNIKTLVKAGTKGECSIVFEPVSVEKSRRLFGLTNGAPALTVFPQSSMDLASPNTYELAAMYEQAKQRGYFDTNEWFGVIDAFGMRGAREKFVYMTSRELTDAGIPVQMVQLLPYIPTIATKLGPKGVLLASLLGPEDPRLWATEERQHILARAVDHPTIGGIYMRLYPAVENVEDVVSVNGAGDTFLGVLVSGLAQGASADKMIDVAQQGAVMSLRSAEARSRSGGAPLQG